LNPKIFSLFSFFSGSFSVCSYKSWQLSSFEVLIVRFYIYSLLYALKTLGELISSNYKYLCTTGSSKSIVSFFLLFGPKLLLLSSTSNLLIYILGNIFEVLTFYNLNPCSSLSLTLDSVILIFSTPISVSFYMNMYKKKILIMFETKRPDLLV